MFYSTLRICFSSDPLRWWWWWCEQSVAGGGNQTIEHERCPARLAARYNIADTFAIRGAELGRHDVLSVAVSFTYTHWAIGWYKYLSQKDSVSEKRALGHIAIVWRRKSLRVKYPASQPKLKDLARFLANTCQCGSGYKWNNFGRD